MLASEPSRAWSARRFLQRMPVQLLSCGVMGSILQCACSAAALDHRDASASLMNFLADFARLANTAHPDTAEAQHAKGTALSAAAALPAPRPPHY